MRTYVGRQHVMIRHEFSESADDYGGGEIAAEDFRRLFLGEPGETADQAASREEVAREVFAELMDEGATDEVAWLNAVYAAQLLRDAPVRRMPRRRTQHTVKGRGSSVAEARDVA